MIKKYLKNLLISIDQWQDNNGHCANAHWWERDEGKDAVIASKSNKNNLI